MTWQPIDTAPKDGTVVILYVPGTDSSVRLGWYVQEETVRHGKVIRSVDEWYWRDGFFSGIFGQKDDAPTHWMPLPEPPAGFV